MTPLPEDYLSCYAAAIHTCGKVTLSEANAFALIHMAERSITYRRMLEQIAGSNAPNADMARHALREEGPLTPSRSRLVTVAVITADT